MSSICPKCSEGFSIPSHLPIILPECLHHLCSTCVTSFKKNGLGNVTCFVNECAASINEEDEKFLSTDFNLLGYLSVHGEKELSQEGNLPDYAVQFFSQIDNIGNISCVRCNKMSQLSCTTCKTEFCSDECFDLHHITPVFATHQYTPHKYDQNVCKEHGECLSYVAVDDLELGCSLCTTSGELRTKKVVRFSRVMEALKVPGHFNHVVDVSNQVMGEMLRHDRHLNSDVQTLSSFLLGNIGRLESHFEKCHRMLQVVEVKAVNDIKEAHEVRVKALLNKRERVEEEIKKLHQTIDVIEAKVDDDNDWGEQDINLVQIVCEIEKLAEELNINVTEGKVDVNIDMSILSSIVNHIQSLQRAHYFRQISVIQSF